MYPKNTPFSVIFDTNYVPTATTNTTATNNNNLVFQRSTRVDIELVNRLQ
jgi:hypothetical protein